MPSPEENTQKVRALLDEYEQFLAGKAQAREKPIYVRRAS